LLTAGCGTNRLVDLEISKPQKNTRNAQAAGQGRRSRSPEYARGGGADRGGRGRNSAVDRYDGRAAPTYRSDEYGRPIRVRDDYRPVRSPTPPRGNFRGRDEYFPRSRDSYDSRDRRRSRSPYGHRDDGRYRERSLSPRGREAVEDADLQIPRRDPRDVPDVQILLMEQLDRDFVSWVEGEMRGRGIKVEVMFLNPRLPLQAVIRRQILEGVHAVSKLDMRCQQSAKIPLQVFDRQGGANNVRFDEYQDLDPKIAAELVLRAKQTQAPPPVQNPQYAQPQFAAGQTYQPPATAPPAPPAANLASLVGQLDNATLQKLLGSYQLPQQQQNAPVVAPNHAIDLAGLLGGLQPQPPQQTYQQPQSVPDAYANLASNPALAALLQNASPPQPAPTQPQSDQQVQNIMASLARFRR
jgi:nuclear polyadenylated RNA-binding protein 3